MAEFHSRFVGATGNNGEFFGDPVTAAQNRFEEWLARHGWERDDEGDPDAEDADDLISEYLADAPADEANEEEIRQHAWKIGKMVKSE